MTLYTGQKPNTPLYLQYATAYNDPWVFNGADYTGDTVKLKIWQYAGASLDVNDACGVSVASGNTTITPGLLAADTTLGYSRGYYSLHNETDDEILAWGEVIIQKVPYS